MDKHQPSVDRALHTAHVGVPVDGVTVHGDLTIPSSARGIVLFAHGSGSSRFSQRNRWVALELQASGLGTLLVDLLTEKEAARDQLTGEYRFDVELLGSRVVGAVEWMVGEAQTGALPTGLFGASTGAAAALIAAQRKPNDIRAVVSRGGRPDLATGVLSQVEAPTLLIVGERDTEVLALNQRAYGQLTCERALEIVPGATHLFEEPGTLAAAASLAREWFVTHFERTPLTVAAPRHE